MAVKIKDTDKGWKEILKQAKALEKKSHVKIGVTQDEGQKSHDDGLITVAEIATFHEFGLGVPKRPFVSRPIDKNKKDYYKILELLKLEIITRKISVEKALALLGTRISEDMKQMILDRAYLQLSQDTIDARSAKLGKEVTLVTPLVDTGQLINSITYEVNL